MEHDIIVITSNKQTYSIFECWQMAFSGSSAYFVGDSIAIHSNNGIVLGTIVDISDNGDYLIKESEG